MCGNESLSNQEIASGLRVLGTLLERSFPGARELRRQMHLLDAEVIDDNGSLSLRPAIVIPAEVDRRIPVEASYDDVDGMSVHVLVHVVDGLLDELEIYRDDLALVILAADEALNLRIEDWT